MTTHLSFVSLFVSLVLAAAGCQKSHDLPRMQAEALAVVKLHGQEVDVLQRRADSLLARGRSLGNSVPGIGDAGRRLADARGQLEQLRTLGSTAQSVLGAAVKTGEVEQVEKTFDEMVGKLGHGTAAARGDLDAVETWLAYSERQPAAAAPAVPAPPVVPPVAPPTEGTPPAPPTDGAPRGPPRPAAPAAAIPAPAPPRSPRPPPRSPRARRRDPARRRRAALAPDEIVHPRQSAAVAPRTTVRPHSGRRAMLVA